MANKLNLTGLSYYHNRLKTLFTLKVDFDALSNTVNELVEAGGEPNVIEVVKVNESPLTPDSSKAVNIPVPEKTSDLENDGYDGESRFATEDFVEENGGKINSISVNGNEQTIDTNKNVDLTIEEFAVLTYGTTTYSEIQAARQKSQVLRFSGKSYLLPSGMKLDSNNQYYVEVGSFENGVYSGHIITVDNQNNWTNEPLIMTIPNKISQLINDKNFQNAAEVQALIDSAIAAITQFDFQIVDELPDSGKKGVIYLVSQGTSGPPYNEFIWVTPEGGTPHYEAFGDTAIDLSNYWSKTELVDITTEEIDALFTA